MFEGDFINGKAEGNGKYIFEDGEYYIGPFKNGLKNEKEYYIIRMEISCMKVIL